MFVNWERAFIKAPLATITLYREFSHIFAKNACFSANIPLRWPQGYLMLSTLPRTFAFRAVAVFMATVLAFPAFAAGIPPAITDMARIVALLRNERPPQFSHAPVVRHDNIEARRDKNRAKWWTPEAKAAYAQLIRAESNDQFLMLGIGAIPLGASNLLPAWGSGSNAGYPIPGEGSFDAGGSGVTSPQGISGALNTATGNTTYSLPISSFPVEGDLEVSLTLYHNTQSTYGGTLGAKWSHSYDSFAEDVAGYTFVQMPHGLVVPYKGSPLSGTYSRPDGWYADLTDDGTDLTMTFKDQSKYVYKLGAGTAFLLSEIYDRHGNVIVVNHDGSDRVTTVEAEDGRTIEFSYSGGYVDTIVGPDSQVWTVTVSSGQLVLLAYPTVGIVDTARAFTYDGNDNLIEEDDPEGNKWYWDHSVTDELEEWWCDVDGANHGTVAYTTGVTTITPPGYAGDYVHTYSGDLLYSIQDPDYFVEYFLNYDTTVRRPMERQDKRGNSEYFVYDGNANITEYTNRRGKVWNYQYSAENDLEEVETPIVYDPPGPPTSAPQTTFYTWTSGLLEEVTNGEGETTEFDYDGDGQLTNVRDGEGRETIYTYDPDTGDVLTVTPPNGATRTMTYDDYGRVLTSSDSIPNTTSYEYDEWGRLKKVTHPDTTYATFTYNLCSQRLTATNEIFKTTQFRYDAAGRLEETENPVGDIITKSYNAAWRVVQVENGRGYSTYYD